MWQMSTVSARHYFRWDALQVLNSLPPYKIKTLENDCCWETPQLTYQAGRKLSGCCFDLTVATDSSSKAAFSKKVCILKCCSRYLRGGNMVASRGTWLFYTSLGLKIVSINKLFIIFHYSYFLQHTWGAKNNYKRSLKTCYIAISETFTYTRSWKPYKNSDLQKTTGQNKELKAVLAVECIACHLQSTFHMDGHTEGKWNENKTSSPKQYCKF